MYKYINVAEYVRREILFKLECTSRAHSLFLIEARKTQRYNLPSNQELLPCLLTLDRYLLGRYSRRINTVYTSIFPSTQLSHSLDPAPRKSNRSIPPSVLFNLILFYRYSWSRN